MSAHLVTTWLLGAIVLSCLVGVVILVILGRPVPEVIGYIGVGALGVLAPSPGQRQPLPPDKPSSP